MARGSKVASMIVKKATTYRMCACSMFFSYVTITLVFSLARFSLVRKIGLVLMYV